jgi:hypothetical protein
MKRTPLRIEPISTWLERYRKGPNLKSVHPVVIAGELVYVSGMPPFDPATGEIARVPFPRRGAGAGATQVVSRDRRLVVNEGAQVQCVLHAEPVTFRGIQRSLRSVFCGGAACAHFRACPVLARALRCGDRLRRVHLKRKSPAEIPRGFVLKFVKRSFLCA